MVSRADPAGLVVSAIDPIGGPVRGGTLLQILGSGFDQLGGLVMHGSPAFGHGSAEPYRRLEAGTFCKFSLDSSRILLGEEPPACAAAASAHDAVIGQPMYPTEGSLALSRATSSRHLRNFSCFSTSTTPSLGRLSAVVQATHVSANVLLCESPAFAGVLPDNRAALKVHVTLNGDYHDLKALSISDAAYSVYGVRLQPEVWSAQHTSTL